MTTSATPVGIYESSRKRSVQNAASDGFGSNFSGAAFCLLHQLVGFLLGKSSYDKNPKSKTIEIAENVRKFRELPF